jgi:hypothetical protein
MRALEFPFLRSAPNPFDARIRRVVEFPPDITIPPLQGEVRRGSISTLAIADAWVPDNGFAVSGMTGGGWSNLESRTSRLTK